MRLIDIVDIVDSEQFPMIVDIVGKTSSKTLKNMLGYIHAPFSTD
jgi:hypothetical protein